MEENKLITNQITEMENELIDDQTIETENELIDNQYTDLKNETEIKMDQIVEEVKALANPKIYKNIEWWNKIPKKQRFQIGDIVFFSELGKYGVVNGPAKKEGLVKVFILKKDLSKGFYNRVWYIASEKLELVKRRKRLEKNYLCVYNRIYKLQS